MWPPSQKGTLSPFFRPHSQHRSAMRPPPEPNLVNYEASRTTTSRHSGTTLRLVTSTPRGGSSTPNKTALYATTPTLSRRRRQKVDARRSLRPIPSCYTPPPIRTRPTSATSRPFQRTRFPNRTPRLGIRTLQPGVPTSTSRPSLGHKSNFETTAYSAYSAYPGVPYRA
jgi:hypothetical protein